MGQSASLVLLASGASHAEVLLRGVEGLYLQAGVGLERWGLLDGPYTHAHIVGGDQYKRASHDPHPTALAIWHVTE